MSAFPGNSLEMQILGPSPRPAETSDSLPVDPAIRIFVSPLGDSDAHKGIFIFKNNLLCIRGYLEAGSMKKLVQCCSQGTVIPGRRCKGKIVRDKKGWVPAGNTVLSGWRSMEALSRRSGHLSQASKDA